MLCLPPKPIDCHRSLCQWKIKLTSTRHSYFLSLNRIVTHHLHPFLHSQNRSSSSKSSPSLLASNSCCQPRDHHQNLFIICIVPLAAGSVKAIRSLHSYNCVEGECIYGLHVVISRVDDGVTEWLMMLIVIGMQILVPCMLFPWGSRMMMINFVDLWRKKILFMCLRSRWPNWLRIMNGL